MNVLYSIAYKMASSTAILAKVLRTRRKALGLTQHELAALANCGPTFVSQLEGAKTTIRFDKLLVVLQVLGLTLTIENGKQVIRDGTLVVTPALPFVKGRATPEE